MAYKITRIEINIFNIFCNPMKTFKRHRDGPIECHLLGEFIIRNIYIVNNYIVRSYRDVIIVTKTARRRTSKT